MQLLRGYLERYPSLDLLDVVFQLVLESEGIESAYALVRAELRRLEGTEDDPDLVIVDSAQTIGDSETTVGAIGSVAMSMHDSGDLLLAIAEGAITAEQASTEIGDVIIGAARGRTADDEITLFNSVGLAIQDLAIGDLIVARAREKGVGLEIDLTA